MSEIRFTVSGDPKGKGRPRFVRATGRAFTPKRTADYESHVAMCAQEAMGSRPPLAGAVHVTIVAVMEIPKSASKKKQAAMLMGDIRPTKIPDVENIGKAVLDGMEGIAFGNDKQVTEIYVEKRYGERPHIEVTVASLERQLSMETAA